MCPECGAPLPESGTCQENFHALLYLEAAVPGAPGGLLHFYAVACYGLQHPDSFGYNQAALEGVHNCMVELVDGKTTLDQVRRATRQAVNGSTRVRRRDGETVQWRYGAWSMHVGEVLEGGMEGYAERVTAWARAIRNDPVGVKG